MDIAVNYTRKHYIIDEKFRQNQDIVGRQISGSMEYPLSRNLNHWNTSG